MEEKYYDGKCPTCGEPFSLRARCLQSESYCVNGHVWHKCYVHATNVLGAVPKGSKLGCTCKKNNKIDVIFHCATPELEKEYVFLAKKMPIFGNIWTNPMPGEVNPSNTKIDYVFAIGGDGTVLDAAQNAIDFDAPLIGINEGHLGFMSMSRTGIPAKHMWYLILEMISGKVKSELREEKRTTLFSQLFGKNILNEIVFLSNVPGKMVDLEVLVNGEILSRYQGDGIIVSTPSGSTAYNLSAGGPILHVDTDLIIITPLASFSLSSRPIVLPGDSKIEVKLSNKNSNDQRVVIVADGRERKIFAGTTTIEKSKRDLKLMRPKEISFVETCREKLQWKNHTK